MRHIRGRKRRRSTKKICMYMYKVNLDRDICYYCLKNAMSDSSRHSHKIRTVFFIWACATDVLESSNTNMRGTSNIHEQGNLDRGICYY